MKIFLVAAGFFVSFSCTNPISTKKETKATADSTTQPEKIKVNYSYDTSDYKHLLEHISNGDTTGKWPVFHEYPVIKPILPFNRIVAFYGNLYSKRMGILGEIPKDSLFRKLRYEVEKWTKADSMLPAIPALHYIAVTAQSLPGEAKKYRLRMPFHQIDTVIQWAKEIDALVFIDIQVGLGTLEEELPEFEKYLSLPNVHFGIDPEFSMKTGKKPGSVIGSFDAADINYVTGYLAEIVRKHKVPPKILVIHRFTQDMVTNYSQIKLLPEVQIVMDMDGWGSPAKKVTSYNRFIYNEPVQYAGFKIFYNNDTKRVGEKSVMQPEDVLKLKPQPVYIQYQ